MAQSGPPSDADQVSRSGSERQGSLRVDAQPYQPGGQVGLHQHGRPAADPHCPGQARLGGELSSLTSPLGGAAAGHRTGASAGHWSPTGGAEQPAFELEFPSRQSCCVACAGDARQTGGAAGLAQAPHPPAYLLSPRCRWVGLLGSTRCILSYTLESAGAWQHPVHLQADTQSRCWSCHADASDHCTRRACCETEQPTLAGAANTTSERA